MRTKQEELINKLGLKATANSYIIHAPNGYKLIAIKNTDNIKDLKDVNWAQAFYKEEKALAMEIPVLKESLTKDGSIWICWPKRSSKVQTDLSDAVVRSIGLACGLVDVKVISVDETWSALKFVFRKADR